MSTKRIGLGYYLELTSSVRRKIHRLARNMGLTKADILYSNAVEAGFGGYQCGSCTEFGLDTLPDGTKLKYAEAHCSSRRRESLFEPEERNRFRRQQECLMPESERSEHSER